MSLNVVSVGCNPSNYRSLWNCNVRFGSSTAAPFARARGSNDSDNGRDGGRLGRLLRDEAFLIAVNIAKLPSVPPQILKDIPRPPNSASRDD
jgi:hypothetical protein